MSYNSRDTYSQLFNDNMDRELDRLEQPEKSTEDSIEEQIEALTEAEQRLRKANVYRSVLDNPLFDDDDDLVLEVEGEIRAFVLERLQVLLGMKAERAQTEAQFAPEVAKVLNVFAQKLLGRPQLLGVDPAQVPAPKPVAVEAKRLVEAPKPVAPKTVAVPSLPPRKRGRPSKKEVAERQEILAKLNQKRPEQPNPETVPVVEKPVKKNVELKPEIKNGKPVVKTIHEVEGKQVVVEHNAARQVTSVLTPPAPMPNPAQMMLLEAGRAADLAENHPIARRVLGKE